MAKSPTPAAPPAPEPTATATLAPPDPLAGYAAAPPVAEMAPSPFGASVPPELLAKLTADAQTADERTAVMPKPMQERPMTEGGPVDPDGYLVMRPMGCYSLKRLKVVNILTSRERELRVPLHMHRSDFPLHKVKKGDDLIAVERVIGQPVEEMYGGENGEQDRNFVLANQVNPYTNKPYPFAMAVDPLSAGEARAMAVGGGVMRAGV